MKRVSMVCDHCKGNLVLGHRMCRWFDPVSGRDFLIHDICERKFLESKQQEVTANEEE